MDSGQVVVVTSSAATAAAASAGGDHCGEHETSAAAAAADSEGEQQQLKDFDGSTSEQTLVNVEPCEELRKFSDELLQDDNSISIDTGPVGFGDVRVGTTTNSALVAICLFSVCLPPSVELISLPFLVIISDID